MKSACRAAKRVLDRLVEGLDAPGASKKSDNAPGVYMALSVENIGRCKLGPVYSFAHYFEQHGDLVPDPDVTVLRAENGDWYPLSFQNAIAYRQSAEIDADGSIRVDRSSQADLKHFVDVFAHNIKAQQRLDVP